MTIQCCMCKRVKQELEWIQRVPALPREVSHTYCPDCLETSRDLLLIDRTTTRKTAAVVA